MTLGEGIMDIYPIKAQYISGENVVIRIELNGIVIEKAELTVRRLTNIIDKKELGLIEKDADLDLGQFDAEFAGYGIELEGIVDGKRAFLTTALARAS